MQAELHLTDGRTHRQTIYDLVDRRRETYTKLYSYICTDGRIDDQIEGQTNSFTLAHRHSRSHAELTFTDAHKRVDIRTDGWT